MQGSVRVRTEAVVVELIEELDTVTDTPPACVSETCTQFISFRRLSINCGARIRRHAMGVARGSPSAWYMDFPVHRSTDQVIKLIGCTVLHR